MTDDSSECFGGISDVDSKYMFKDFVGNCLMILKMTMILSSWNLLSQPRLQVSTDLFLDY